MKKFETTEERKRQVKILGGLGIPHLQIAAILGCSRDTLEKNFKEELIVGKAEANTKISQRLFDSAMKGNTALLIFWAKTQMNWKEVQGIELSGKDGEPLADAKEKLLARIPKKEKNKENEHD